MSQTLRGQSTVHALVKANMEAIIAARNNGVSFPVICMHLSSHGVHIEVALLRTYVSVFKGKLKKLSPEAMQKVVPHGKAPNLAAANVPSALSPLSNVTTESEQISSANSTSTTPVDRLYSETTTRSRSHRQPLKGSVGC